MGVGAVLLEDLVAGGVLREANAVRELRGVVRDDLLFLKRLLQAAPGRSPRP